MRVPVEGLAAFLLCGVLTQLGCGPNGSAPPPRLTVTPNTTATASAKVVFMILPASPDKDPVMLTWATAGQAEAAERRAIFRVVNPDLDSPATWQEVAIRRAIEEGASALVVVPQDPRAIAPVLSEAESRGVAVVTLGASSADAPQLPGTAVVPERFAGSADRLVEAAVADARANGATAEPSAVILIAEGGDRFSGERVEALQAAAKRAGLSRVESLRFEVKGQADGRMEGLKALKRYLGDHPETSIVLAEGDEAMAAASRLRSESAAEKPIFVAGYMGFLGQTNPDTLLGNSAFVEGQLDRLARLAVQTALAKAEGEPIDTSVVMPTPLNRSLGGAMRDDIPRSGAASSQGLTPSSALGQP